MLLYWIWFAELKNITLLHKHRLLEQFSNPQELYDTADVVLQRHGLSQSVRNALQEKDLHEAERILHRCTQTGIKVLPVTDVAYPSKLRNTPDAPVLLYYKGVLPDWDARPFIGIVGTRKASDYGLQVAYQMGSQIASCGGQIVSGGASGGDAAAMQGAMDAGYPVVGVLGFGVDVVYPDSNRKLFTAVVNNGGCLVSEYPPGTRALRWHFPARNRIISGLSNGVLVVEAPKISGSLITARRALEQGRDVFAVPGNINTAICEGSNLLLQEGATPALCGWDVLCTYEFLYPGKLKKQRDIPRPVEEQPSEKMEKNPRIRSENSKNEETARKKPVDKQLISSYSVVENKELVLSEDEQTVLAQLTRQPQEPADLIARVTLPAGKVLSALTMLTVKGIVQKHPGGRVSLK